MTIQNFFFIDARVQNHQAFVAGLQATDAWVLLKADQEGLDQMVQALSGVKDLASIQIISHGAEASLTLGSTALNLENVQNHQVQLAALGASLAPQGDIQLYGCDVAQGVKGEQFVQAIAQLTQADVAASKDLTGAAAAGGNWKLEYAVGHIDTSVLVPAHYSNTLAAVLPLQVAPHIAYINTPMNYGPDAGEGLYVAAMEDITGSLPEGLTIDETSHLITGLTEVAGFTWLSATMADVAGNEAAQPLYQPLIFVSDIRPSSQTINHTSAAAAKLYQGTSGDDKSFVLYNAPGDVLLTKEGDDVVTVSNANGMKFSYVDGGAGTDTMKFTVVDMSVDFSQFNNPASGQLLKNFEVFQFSGKDASVSISAADIFGMSSELFDEEHVYQLRIDGTTGGNQSGIVMDLTPITKIVTNRAGDEEVVNQTYDATGTQSNSGKYHLYEGTFTDGLQFDRLVSLLIDKSFIDLTTPPYAGDLTVGLRHDSASDTGFDAEDNITNSAELQIVGTAPAGMRVLVELDGKVYGGLEGEEIFADLGGNWSVTIADLPEGDYTPVARLVDVVGNESESVEGDAFTVDLTPPEDVTANLAHDAENDTGVDAEDNITNNTAPEISGTAEAGAFVTVTVGDWTTDEPVLVGDDGTWTVTVGIDLEDGEYTPMVTVEDVAGNKLEEFEGEMFTVKTAVEAPAVNAFGDTEGNDTGIPDDFVTSNNTPMLSGTAEEGAWVTVTVGDWVSEPIEAVGGEWSVTVGELANGEYTPEVVAVDAAGNQSEAVLGETFTVCLYNTPAAENTKTVTTLAVNDALLGTAPKYTLSGLDASLFKVSSKGVLTFAAVKDYEQPVDSNKDGVYEVAVTLSNAKTGYKVVKDLTVGVEFVPINGTAGADVLKGTAGWDTLNGLAGDDKLTGGTGLDTFLVTSGHDTILDFNALTKGATGSEVLQVSAGAKADATLKAAWVATSDSFNEGTANLLTKGMAVDLSGITDGLGWNVTNKGATTTIKGSQFDDVLTGGTGNDQLSGGAGNDVLIGGKGFDFLTGGTGADTFRLGGDTKTDHITDFWSGNDRIELDNLVFKALLTEGQLTANQFAQGTAAITAAQRIIYDQPTGNLWYDLDGSGKKAAVLMAVLDNKVQIASSDFWVI